jgi:O-acetyl-ADP-ribose deacetylase (regulator of RNase III)
MGTGQLGYPKDKVAEMMYQTVIDFDRKCAGTKVKEVKFVCYSGDLETCDVRIIGSFPPTIYLSSPLRALK